MNSEYILSDHSLYIQKDAYSLIIQTYANDYELLTFFYTKYNFRKYIQSFNDPKKISHRKPFPIPLGIQLHSLGNSGIYFLDMIHFLPSNLDILLIKIIGPNQINDSNQLILYHDEEKILKEKKDNHTHTLFYYYHWNNKTKYSVQKTDLNYSFFDINIKINNKLKKSKDCVFIKEFSISKKNKKSNEINSLPLRIQFIQTGLDCLKKNGFLYLEYFNCSQRETLVVMMSLMNCFEKVNFIRSKLYENTLMGGYYIFQGFNQNLFMKNININKKDILNHDFIKYINHVQQSIYKQFKPFLKKCALIEKRRKPKSYFENYQISIGIDWCIDHNVLINSYYEQKLYKETSYFYLKKIFYPQHSLNYKKLKLYYDSFYSVTFYEDYIEIMNVIKKYFPKEKIIIDACANVGASTISLSFDFEKVYGIEISKERFKLLKNNINVYKKKNIDLICNDYLKIQNQFKKDLVFFDPPWSGIYYKIEEQLELYLGTTNIKECLKKHSKFIMKTPFNYHYQDMKDIIVERLPSFLLIIKKE